jgi:hypothetical protein
VIAKLDPIRYHVFYVAHSFSFLSEARPEFKRVWVATLDEKYVAFKVKACHDARLMLSKHVGITTVDSHEIHIGANNNTMIYFRNIDNGVITQVAEKVVHGLLSCSASRWFWISWTTGVIELGQGSNVGHEILLTWPSGHPEPIEGVSISTDISAPGTWEFTTLAGQISRG